MPRGLNFLGTMRQLFTPKTVKYLDPREMRKQYSHLRSIAVKRQKRLEAAGIDNYVTRFELPPTSALNDDQMTGALLDVSRILRNPTSYVRPAREEQKELQAAAEAGDLSYYSARDKKQFGDFMEEVRRRGQGHIKESYLVKHIYEEALSKGMRPKTLLKHFDEYLREKPAQLEAALNRYIESGEKSRLTIAKLNAVLS